MYRLLVSVFEVKRTNKVEMVVWPTKKIPTRVSFGRQVKWVKFIFRLPITQKPTVFVVFQ